ncbi:hypothetical protein CsSME_00016075 [Camellia sinensis var. sinensis]
MVEKATASSPLLGLVSGWVRLSPLTLQTSRSVSNENAMILFNYVPALALDQLLALLVEESTQAERSGHPFPLTIVFVERKCSVAT